LASKIVSKVVVVGAGIGGLTCAALLAQAGYDVTVLESQIYPGGCASTWTHKGFRFESGATVAGGFHANGPHALVGAKLGIEWPVRRHDPAWVVHLPGHHVGLTSDNAELIAEFPETAKFWEQQSQLADTLWRLSARNLPWPPTDLTEIGQLIKAGLPGLRQNISLLPYAFISVYDWVKRLGLADDAAFMRFLDGQLLISAQATSQEVNALWGAVALDLARKGVYHVRGGIGGIAQTLVDRLRELGGRIVYRQRVTRMEVSNGETVGVWARRGRLASEEIFYPADFVIANMTPWDVDEMLGEHSPASLKREVARRKVGWGAFVLHMGVRDDVIPEDFPEHHQILVGVDGPLGETRSIFISISPAWDDTRAPLGQRAVTVTTHTDPMQWWSLLEIDRDAYYALKEEYTSKIVAAIDGLLPGFAQSITLSLPGTPVTYQYYTDRDRGQVGGFPIRSLLKVRGPRTGIRNLRIVGDSIFPGQSTAAVTLGAMRVAADVQRNLGLYAVHVAPHTVELSTDAPDDVSRREFA
jgi:C-3',4' desaturase CrtD